MLSFLKKEYVHIAMLQETHLSINEHSKLKHDWVGQVVSSSFKCCIQLLLNQAPMVSVQNFIKSLMPF